MEVFTGILSGPNFAISKIQYFCSVSCAPCNFKQPIIAHFWQRSFHSWERTEQIGAIIVASLIVKNRKIAYGNSTARSVRSLAVESIMEHLVSRKLNRLQLQLKPFGNCFT